MSGESHLAGKHGTTAAWASCMQRFVLRLTGGGRARRQTSPSSPLLCSAARALASPALWRFRSSAFIRDARAIVVEGDRPQQELPGTDTSRPGQRVRHRRRPDTPLIQELRIDHRPHKCGYITTTFTARKQERIIIIYIRSAANDGGKPTHDSGGCTNRKTATPTKRAIAV